MTKEEIIRSKVQYIKEFGVPDYLADIVIKKDALLAMEEYAKQQILLFMGWCHDNEIMFEFSDKGDRIGLLYRNGKMYEKEFEELYFLFLKETAK